jgi:hypothetical protein
MKIGDRDLELRPTEIQTQVLPNWDGNEPVTPPGTNVNQNWEWRSILYAQHMTPIFLPFFRLPGIVRNLSANQAWHDHFAGGWSHIEPFEDPGVPMWFDEKIDDVLIARLMAKMAHGMAVWSIGLDGFRPFLTDIIRGKDLSQLFYFVGGEPKPVRPNKVGKFPHQLEIATGNINGHRQKNIFAAIRLFADRSIPGYPELGGPPIYHVVIGEKL